MKIFNTMSRSLEEFEPHVRPDVRLYTCGPTVYNYAHIGNFRAYVFEDLLRRYLKFKGFSVTQVMNLTDVDDKTINGANAMGVTLDEFTRPYKEAFFADLEVIRVEPAEHYPAATDHIEDMIHMIQKLIDKGHAYQSEDGSVYFRIQSFDDYGRLAHLDLDGLQSGARVAQDEYDKENLADFALWKTWVEADGNIYWDSPWGRGRPGWHIECSAMSTRYLGNSFDLHTGGVDNIFPHHEDEIAQSECASGERFVKYWMHCEHLMVNGGKMSKSLGNFFTLRDLLEKGYTGREVRYVLIAAHYRQQLNFQYRDNRFESLESARASLKRFDECYRRLSGHADDSDHVHSEWLERYRELVLKELDHDLNVPGALGHLFDLVSECHSRLDAAAMTQAEASFALKMLADVDRVLAVLLPDQKEGPSDDIIALAEERKAARQAKDWSEADRLRDELAGKGWIVKDSPDGYDLIPS
jgi:cysteinyl-tRNA synthetase